MSNHPFRSTTPEWAYTDTSGSRRPTAPQEDRRRCSVCDKPVNAWFFIDLDGLQARINNTDNKFENDDFCSVRCIKRRLNGLSDDDDRAMDVLLKRVESAERAAKDAEAVASAHLLQQDSVRAALATVLQTAPGLAKGAVAPPGALLARQVAALQSLVNQKVFATPAVGRRRPH